MSRRFVLLSAARSGTSLIIETLRTHPQALVHGEIFHEKVEWHVRSEFLACNDVAKRDVDPIGFARDILAQDFGHDAVGFKMWREQNETVCDYLLRDPTVVKIILKRENRLAHFSSCVLAQVTDVWNVRSNDRLGRVAPRRLSFSRNGLLNFIRHHEELHEYYMAKAVGRVVLMEYLEAARLEFGELFLSLGLAQMELEPQTRKLYGDRMLDRYDYQYHDLIRRTLSELGKSEWLWERV